MTKKHFALLAAALKLQKPEYTGLRYHQWTHDVVAVASACKVINPKVPFRQVRCCLRRP